MGLSTQSVVSDGTLSVLDLSFEFYDHSEVSVVFNNVPDPSAWIWSGTQNNRILFNSPVPNGVEVFVFRTTAVDQVRHDFTSGAAFRAPTLDDNFEQILRVAQEFHDWQGSGNFRTDIDVHGFQIKRLGDASDPQDAVPYNQMQAYVATELAEAGATVDSKLLYTLRTPETVPQIPGVAARANKLLSFDSAGYPQAAIPTSDSAQGLRLDLASTSPGVGSGLVGHPAEVNSTANTLEKYLNNVGPLYNGVGVVRQLTSGGGWSFITDGGHAPRGFSDATTSPSDKLLVLNYGHTGYKVGSFSITCDETYAALGIAAGASVAQDKATVYLYQAGNAAINMSTLAVTPATYFIGDITVATNATLSQVEITHPNCGSASLIPNLQGVDSAGQAFNNRIVGYGSATQTNVATFTEFAGYIEWSGSAWTVQTSCKAKPTCVFNTSTGELVVTRETISGSSEAQTTVIERDNGGATFLEARAGASLPGQFSVYFRDPTSKAIQTTPHTNMKFYYRAPAQVRRESPVGVIAFQRMNMAVDAKKVFAGSGNFWVNYQLWK